MITSKIIISNKAGLHARSAAKLVSTVEDFDCTIEIGTAENMVDGKSILSIMLLAASKGTELVLIINGPDEEQTLNAILDLVDNRFGED